MDALIVDEARLAGGLVRLTKRALEEAGRALVTVRIDAERKLAAGSGEGHLVVLASSTVHGPVVVAVVVHGALAVEQEAVLALLQGQCTCDDDDNDNNNYGLYTFLKIFSCMNTFS